MEASSIAEEEEFPEEEFYEGEFEEEEETQEERFERLKREKELLIQKQEEEERKRAEHEAMINEKLKLYFPHLFKVNTVHQPTKKAQNKSPRVKPKEALHPEVNEKFMKYVNSFVTHSGSMRNFMNNHKNDWFGYCDKNGRNMLHVVAKMGDFYRFALLLNANQAALTLRDSEWKTPLSYVLELSEQETKRKMFNTILEKREILDIGMAREIIEFAESEKSDYYRKILDPYETQKKVYRAPSKKSKFASTK